MSDRVIGARLFTDDKVRIVYEDADGRQYVLGDDGTRVPGVWMLPPDEPFVIERAAGRDAP